MIVWNEKVKKSQDIIEAVINQLYKETINTDGVVEIFNNGKEQGCVLKLFDKFNPNLDLCMWVYMPSERKINNHIEVVIGKHINCNKLNMWDGDDLESFSFEDVKAREMHNKTRDFMLEKIKDNFERIYNIRSI
ncbi:MAG: hypothetical protein E7166_00870 [Firmicutes bacterium]|nr:hypothetical protein [Bacillota bacterium]